MSPLYVYECSECGEKIEILNKSIEKALALCKVVTCPMCKQEMKKIISSSNFVVVNGTPKNYK